MILPINLTHHLKTSMSFMKFMKGIDREIISDATSALKGHIYPYSPQ